MSPHMPILAPTDILPADPANVAPVAALPAAVWAIAAFAEETVMASHILATPLPAITSVARVPPRAIVVAVIFTSPLPSGDWAITDITSNVPINAGFSVWNDAIIGARAEFFSFM